MLNRRAVCSVLVGLAVVLVLTGCQAPVPEPEAEPIQEETPEPRSTTVVHSGGASEWSESEGGYELRIYQDEQDGIANGLSPALAASIFASGSGACGTREDQLTFRCVDLGCSAECRVWSADKDAEDDSTNRVEPVNEEGFVYSLPGKVYWCKCE